MAKKLCALHKAEQEQGMLYITIDGDSIGSKVGRAVLNDDEAALVNMSNIINGAQKFMAETLQKLGGKIIELGGDELTAKIPQAAVSQLEQMRQQVQQQFGFTVTCGIGSKLSEAAKSLLVGKTNGKDQIVMYGHEVDQQLSEVSDRLNNGQGSEEDQKISDHYLEGNDMKQSEEKDPKAQDHEHSGDDCEYCREMEADPDEDQAAQEGEASPAEGQDPDQAIDPDQEDPDHDEEECEYCSATENEDQMAQGAENQDADGQDTETDDQQIGEVPPSSPTIDEHTEEGMKQIAEAIEDQEGGNPAEQQLPADDQMPVGENMDDGTSRPDDFDNDDSGEHTMGLSEEEADDEGPDLGSVLKDGLDNHAQNIQKEKVSQMVGQALQGFKSQKKVLEMAKEQAPEFYQASIAMLRSMIEMAKMLGFSGDDEVPTQENGPDEAQAPEKQVPQEQSAAPAKEGGAPPPKPKGQSAKA